MTELDPVLVPAEAVDEVKTYLRVDLDEEDASLASLLGAAVAHGERFTGRVFLERTCLERMPATTAWQRLEATPVREIASVTAIDAEGVRSVLPVSGYAIDIDRNGDGWVRLTVRGTAKAVELAYAAGLVASWGALPETLRQGALRLTGHLFAVRDDPGDAGPPPAVAALWRPWRRTRLT